MSLIEFPYILHKGFSMPIIPITILNEKVWVYVDSGAMFSIFYAQTARRMGINIQDGRLQMIVVGDGSYIPTYLHDLSIHIGEFEIKAPIGFSERLGVGFNLLGRKGIFDQFQVCFNDQIRRVTFQKN
jgi:hypothetical protein